MSVNNVAYDSILEKIALFKAGNPDFRDKEDSYAFSALCIKNSIYKNPTYNLSNELLKASVIDGTSDGGADFLLQDPNGSETSDLIIGQAKMKGSITFEEAKNAVSKMVDFYVDLKGGNYQRVRADVATRFLSLYSEVSDEGKIRFLLYTTAPQNHIQERSLAKIVKDRLGDEDRYEFGVFFGKDVVEEIKEAESRRPYVESGKLTIDEANNCLRYGDDEAVIVNISAKSLRELYVLNSINLFSMNLRYFVSKRDIDSDIRTTIREDSENFWFKNNGITIVCDEFKISGKELKLKNFSIVNGGQTTTLVYKSNLNDSSPDFFIVCKVILSKGNNPDDRSDFILQVAKATNSQKPIKNSDLKANAPEQVHFANEMNNVGVYYKTKRGESIPRQYRDYDYLNSDLPEVGKLSLAGIFQLPATSRNKPSTMYMDRYYQPTFETDQKKVSGIIRDLLYMDSYFKGEFIRKIDREHPEEQILSFAHNARTLCLSFVALGARIYSHNLEKSEIRVLVGSGTSANFYEEKFYPVLKKLDNYDRIIAKSVFCGDKDVLNGFLYKLYFKIIKEGNKCFVNHNASDPSLNETNFLKKDSSYFEILKQSWLDLEEAFEDNKALFDSN